jgi:phosphoribosylamine--glycine ligase
VNAADCFGGSRYFTCRGNGASVKLPGMNVLVIGQGGREHALVKALQLSPSVQKIHALPGNDGMADEAICHALDWQDFAALEVLLKREKIELVIVGPEVPLAGGIVDAIRGFKGQGVGTAAAGSTNVLVFGPSGEAAQLEASKVFSKEFMQEFKVPTARSFVVRSVAETLHSAATFAPPYVLKADGLAAGKGVFICADLPELEKNAHAIFEQASLGEAGSSALLEEFQSGYEISYLILTNGETYEPLVLSQDHKRLQDGDLGPNTGGMGTVAPMPVAADLEARIRTEVLEPVMRGLKARGFSYRGVLYVGLMITASGPSVIEFNVRFGDPEAQVILPLLDGDWAQVFSEVAAGRIPRLRWKKAAAACVVMAAEGYPDNPLKDVPMTGDFLNPIPDRYFLHAGTRWDRTRQTWLTNGGRVLNSVGIGADLRQALQKAYKQSQNARWPGQQMRKDIGKNIL